MEAKKKTIIFVCTSNTCRSPMAEAFAGSFLRRRNLMSRYEVVSRALTDAYEPENSPASSQGVEVLKNLFDLDISSHRSKLLNAEDVNNAALIVGVSRNHSARVRELFPSASGRIVHLSRDIADPWHQPAAVYQRCAETMIPLIEEILSKIPDN